MNMATGKGDVPRKKKEPVPLVGRSKNGDKDKELAVSRLVYGPGACAEGPRGQCNVEGV